MPNSISTLLFDFDGVIADTDTARFKILKKILPNYDHTLAKSFTRNELIGLSTKKFLLDKSNSLPEAQIDSIIRMRHMIYFSNLEEYCIPFPKMKETIRYFNSVFELAIVTTGGTENVKIQLQHLNIIDCFKWVIGREISEDGKFRKTYTPIPAIINKKLAECIVIEDSNVGVHAARKAGFYCIRFDPDRLYKNGKENEKVMDYPELKKRINRMASL